MQKESYQVTKWGAPLSSIETRFYTLSYEQWLGGEVRRFEGNDREAWVERNQTEAIDDGISFLPGSAIALFSNREYYKETPE